MSEEKTDWRGLIIGFVVTGLLSLPTWLPVFGIDPEWFGSGLVVAVQMLLPIIALAAGFLIGGYGASRRLRERDARIAELQKANSDLKARLKPYEDRELQIERALENCGDNELAVLWNALVVNSAFTLDEFPLPDSHGALVKLRSLGLLDRDEASGRWLVPLDVSERVSESYELWSRLEDAVEQSTLVQSLLHDGECVERARDDVAAMESGPYWQKVMLTCLLDKGEVVIVRDEHSGPDALAVFEEKRTETMSRMVRTVTVGPGSARVELSEDGAYVVSESPELLKGVRWKRFIVRDKEFAGDKKTGPIHVSCEDMAWMVDVDL